MGKRRKMGGGLPIKKKSTNSTDDPKDSLLDPTSRSFIYDEVDDYEEEKDCLAISRAQNMMKRKKESKEQILAIGGSSSEASSGDESDQSDKDANDDDEFFMGDDDIIDENVDSLPDERAWGKRKGFYFGTDTSDEKIQKKMRSENENLAKLEEETARRLQYRLAAEVDNLPTDDLIIYEEGNNTQEKNESVVEMNISGLSKSKKLQLIKRESPEFIPLLNDLKIKTEELFSCFSPLMSAIRENKIPSEGNLNIYIKTKYHLLFNYVTVLNAYMMTKCCLSSAAISRHPVVGRLAQYRQLLKELEPCDEMLMPQLTNMVKLLANGKPLGLVGKDSKKVKHLRILSKASGKESKKQKLSSLLEYEKDKGIPEVENDMVKDVADGETLEEDENNRDGVMGADERRAISYKISKNKGLTPSRKKDQSNPRLRYRNKYQDKLKRRKGQVRLVRTEVKRYDGEVSGIKTHTIKSVRIK